MTYNFHGLIEVSLDTSASEYSWYLENEYRRIHESTRTDRQPGARITVHIVHKLPEQITDDIRREVHFKKLFRLGYIVRGIGTNDVHVYFRRHPVDRVYVTAVGVFLQAHVIEPLMYMMLLDMGIMLLHAAGVMDDNGAYVFPAEGGTGKTSLSLSLIQQDFQLLGDDLLLVDARSGVVHPYPRPLHLFTYNINALRGAKLPPGLRATVRTKNVIRWLLERITGSELLISTRVHADQIYSGLQFGASAKLRRLIYLVKTGDSGFLEVAEHNNAFTAAQTLVDSADLNRSLYELLGDRERIDMVRQAEMRVAMQLLSWVERFEFYNTRASPADELAMMLR